MLAYPAPIYVHGRFATVDELGTLYLILGVLSVVAVFGCQLYRKQQNGIGINAGARGIPWRRSSLFPGWRPRRGVNVRSY